MKRNIVAFLLCIIALTALLAAGCQPTDKDNGGGKEQQSTQAVIELDENNYWKYFTVGYDMSNLYPGGKGQFSYDIRGVLDYALYDEVVFSFDVFYYTDGQKVEDYQSYTMRIACNAAGDMEFETNYLGITNVTVGKWLGANGSLVSFNNYHWKIQLNSVVGKVIYSL